LTCIAIRPLNTPIETLRDALQSKYHVDLPIPWFGVYSNNE
jgi:hypothetical protein